MFKLLLDIEHQLLLNLTCKVIFQLFVTDYMTVNVEMQNYTDP